MKKDEKVRFRILVYQSLNRQKPFEKWLNSVPDKVIVSRILARVRRMSVGNLGDIKSVGKGVIEARLMFGSGFRIYFAIEAGALIILLLGGDKSTQTRDIELAQGYWEDFKRRSTDEEK